MKKISIPFVLIVLFAFGIKAQTTVSDADENVYNTVTIGTQMWTKENLKTTKYNDGTSIALITNNAEWSNLNTGAYCQYPTYGDVYGNIYNFYAVTNSKNLCPTDWHVATYDDWDALATYLGGLSVAASKLKEIGTAHWGEPNTDATNESGFTAFGGGYRKYDGVFYNILDEGYFWTGTETGTDYAYYSVMHPAGGDLTITDNDKKDGMSVRCVKNPSAGMDKSNNQSIEVYPNPVYDYLIIANNQNYIKFEIFNSIGQIIFTNNMNQNIENKIDITNWNSGIYNLKIFDDKNNVYSSNIVKI